MYLCTRFERQFSLENMQKEQGFSGQDFLKFFNVFVRSKEIVNIFAARKRGNRIFSLDYRSEI